MLGRVENYDDERQTGTLKGTDKYYEFHIDDWGLDAQPQAGDAVDFMPEDDGSATSISAIAGVTQHDITPVKRRIVAALLGLFTGWLGLHRIYLGFYRIAILQLTVTAVTLYFGAPGYAYVWGFVEGFLLMAGLMHKDAKGRPLK